MPVKRQRLEPQPRRMAMTAAAQLFSPMAPGQASSLAGTSMPSSTGAATTPMMEESSTFGSSGAPHHQQRQQSPQIVAQPQHQLMATGGGIGGGGLKQSSQPRTTTSQQELHGIEMAFNKLKYLEKNIQMRDGVQLTTILDSKYSQNY
jgi:hypothetical protein